jgi:hypothetical protein
MKIFTFLACGICLWSCTTKIIPIKGEYPSTPIVYSSTQPFDSAWDKVIDLFAQKGLTIKLIDRSSGLIVSEKTVLITSMEDDKGKAISSLAEIVVPKYKDGSTNGRYVPISGTTSGPYAAVMVPRPIFGEWNVRLKKLSTGGTSINININNLFYLDEYIVGGHVMNNPVPIQFYKSTGIFEQFIYDQIK